jgi:hypothetical protein
MAKGKPVLEPRIYPLHRGPFLFAPHFLSKTNWFGGFESLISDVLETSDITGKILNPYDGRQALIEIGAVEMTVDGDGGVFCVDQLGVCGSNDDDSSRWSGPLAAPLQFFQEMDTDENVERLGSDYKNVCTFSKHLYQRMRNRFEKAIREGFAQIFASLDQPLNPLSSIEFHNLRHLRFVNVCRDTFLQEDFELDDAVTQDGRKAFGLGVSPTGLSSPTMRKRPGRKKQFKDADIDAEILVLLHKRGVPEQGMKWNDTQLVNRVMKALGSKAPRSGNTIRKRIVPAIEKYETTRKHVISSNSATKSR